MRMLRYLSLLLVLVALPLFAANHKPDVYARATKLAAILEDAQTSATITSPAWKTVANEAHYLSNMLMSDTHGAPHDLASDARKHVRLMRTAAGAGDAATAKSEAKAALEPVTKLIDWSAPAK
jgi:hypothetical protein